MATSTSIVLLDVPEDVSMALDRELGPRGYRLVALPAWSPAVAPTQLALIVAASDAPVATAISLRRSTSVPVLILARTDGERAAALDAGADVCLGRADATRLVVAQARALLRRRDAVATAEGGPLRAGTLLLDPGAHVATAGSVALDLSPREFALLGYLAARPGRALRRGELLANVWGPRYVGETNTVDVHIAWLRQKLPPDSGVRITTLRGIGYRFDVLA